MVFIDEMGVRTDEARRYGRSAKGERAFGKRPGKRGKNTTIIGMMTMRGVEDWMSFDGGVGLLEFEVFIEHCLAPRLLPGDLVIMDNLKAHRNKLLIAKIEKTGAFVVHLPTYSPELNPIELVWAKVKSIVRKERPRNRDEIEAVVLRALDSILPPECRAYYRHCGYANQTTF